MNKGKKNLNAVLLIMSVVLIIIFIGTSSKIVISAKTSEFKIEDGVLKQYLGSEKDIVIPKGVKTIGAGAFKDCTMEKVAIPDSVNLIEYGAFQNCSKLTEIVIPCSVSELGQSAFQGCSSLYRVELPYGRLYTVGVSAFEDCVNLQEVIIPDTVNILSQGAFKNCTSLEMIDLPESIRSIGGECFENCINLETIFFPTQEFFIGSWAFYNTLWMNNYEGDNVIINHTLVKYRGEETDITIPDNITVIGDEAFADYTFITNVNIPMGVIEIGNSTFCNCTGLTEIVLPDSVTKVGASAFYGCINLEKITIPKNVYLRHDSLEETKWMMDYQGDFIILNGYLVGYQGTDLIVVIPDNVTTICTGAFSDYNMANEIIVPKSVVKLCYAGFSNCMNLQKVFIMNKSINIDYETFLDCNSDMKLYGLAGGTAEEYAKRNNIQFESYGLTKTKVTLYLGGNDTVSLRVDGIDGKVQWKSEDETIAKVNENGKVTAVKTGTTKINATINGVTMTCEIIVKTPYISKSSVSITVGWTSRLNVVGISSGITWSSCNNSVASVSSSGVITANKVGTATITATFNGKSYTCKVTVR